MELHKKSRWLFCLVMVVILAVAAACGTTAPSDEGSEDGGDGGVEETETVEDGTPEAVEIRYAFWGLPEEVEVQEQLKEAFEEKYPHITVNLDHISTAEGFPSTVLTQIAGGNAPDVFYLGEAVVSGFAERGVLLDLMPLAQEGNLDFEDFFPGVLNPMGYEEGHLWAMPKDATPYMMYYNKELFDQGGVPHPEPDWTWEDFEAKAKALTIREGDRTTQFGFAADLWWGPQITAIYKNGGDFISDDKTELVVDNPRAIEALEWYKSLLYEDGGVSPTPESDLGMSNTDLFNAERAAMVSGGRWVSFFIRPLESEWGVVPFPQNRSAQSPLLFVTLNVPENTEHPEAAWRFIDFVISEEGQKINSSTGLGMPVRQSVTASGAWLQEGESEEHIDIFLNQLNNTKSLPFHPQWAETIDDVYARHIDGAFRQEISVEEALRRSVEEANDILAQE